MSLIIQDSGGASALPPLNLSNFVANGAIGTAAATVDKAINLITFNQATTGTSLTVPAGTSVTDYKVINFQNIGTASLTLNFSGGSSADLLPKSFVAAAWNGSSWAILSTGLQAEYINVVASAAQVAIVSGQAVTFNTPIIQGSIPFSAGVFTLAAGKTYRLVGSLGQGSGAAANPPIIQWRNITSNTLIGVAQYIDVVAILASTPMASTLAEAVITPAITTTVRLEVINAGGAVTSVGVSDGNGNRMPYATITQIGSTAASPVPLTSPWVSGRNYNNAINQTPSTAGVTTGTNICRCMTVTVPNRVTLKNILTEVTTVGTSTYRWAMYKADSTLYPTELVFDSSFDVGSTTVGVKTPAAVSVVVEPGIYLLVIKSNGTVTTRSLPAPSLEGHLGCNIAAGFTQITAYDVPFTWVAGVAFPAAFPAALARTNVANIAVTMFALVL